MGELCIKPTQETTRNLAWNFSMLMLWTGVWTIGAGFHSAPIMQGLTTIGAHASARTLGLLGLLGWAALPLQFVAVNLTEHLRTKKWAVILTHTPYHLQWIILAVGLWMLRSFAHPQAMLILIAVAGLVGALSGSLVSVPTQDLISRLIPTTHRARFATWFNVCGKVGSGLGAVSILLIFGKDPDARKIAVALLLAFLLHQGSLVFISLCRETPHPIERERPKIASTVIAVISCWKDSAAFRRFCLLMTAFSFLTIPFGYLTHYAITRFGIKLEMTAWFSLVVLVASFPAALFFGHLGDRLTRRTVMRIAVILWIATYIVTLVARGPGFLMIAIVLSAFAGIPISILEMAIMAMDPAGERVASYVAAFNIMNGILMPLLGMIVGTLITLVGHRMVFMATIPALVIMLLISRQLSEPGTQTMTMPEPADSVVNP